GGGEGQQGIAGSAPGHACPLQGSDGDDGLVAAVVGGGWVLAATVVGAGGAESFECGGVVEGFGGEVAAVAEHVGPAAERFEAGGGVAAEVPGGADQPALVAARVAVVAEVINGDTASHGSDRLGGLGGVLGQVGRDGNVGGLSGSGDPDCSDVELGAPADFPPVWLCRVGDGGEPRRGGGGDRGGELIGGQRRLGELACVGGGIEAEDGVEVDQAAGLELGHLGVGELHCPGPGGLGGFGEVAADGDGGAPPQLGSVRGPGPGA